MAASDSFRNPASNGYPMPVAGSRFGGTRFWKRAFRRVLGWKPEVSPPCRTELAESLSACPGITGCVDETLGSEIRGWVVDAAEPNRYLTVCLMVNGKLVQKSLACVFRKNLEQRFQSGGLHGFAFTLPSEPQKMPESSIEIRLEDSRSLCSPFAIRNSSAGNRSPGAQRNPGLLFMHIPKTAGTAVRSALRSDALTDRQIWLYPEPPGLPVEHLLRLTESQLSRVECIVGHYEFGLHLLLPTAVKYATIVRNPVDRCISTYYHARFRFEESVPERRLDLDEFVRKLSGNVLYDNLMVRMLTGSVSNVPFGSMTVDLLRQAKENIRSSFCYVGLQTRTDAAVASMAQFLRLQPLPISWENRGRYKKGESLSPSTVAKLSDFNSLDAELFDYVQKRFWDSGAEGWVGKVQDAT